MTPRTRLFVAAAVVVVIAGAAGLYWFKPWLLFIDRTVNETLPTYATPGARSPSISSTATAEQGNVLLASGTFISHEHDTSGTANLIRLASGQVQLAISDLATSNGPDLHVWLTDQPVLEGSDGWHVFDDGRYVELGPLKGNIGNQVYDVPAGTDLTGLTSVSIWCVTFAVSFGAATLDGV